MAFTGRERFFGQASGSPKLEREYRTFAAPAPLGSHSGIEGFEPQSGIVRRRCGASMWWRQLPSAWRRSMSGLNASDLATLAATIAHSQIVVRQPRRPAPPLPPGFEAVDLAILEWIAAEGRRAGRRLALA
jgi:hypothetical protein